MGKGIMALVNTRPELKKYFTKKGTLRKPRGQPKLDIGIQFTIYAKVDQISKSRKLTMWKAWLQLTNHSQFPRLMAPHFAKRKKYMMMLLQMYTWGIYISTFVYFNKNQSFFYEMG